MTVIMSLESIFMARFLGFVFWCGGEGVGGEEWRTFLWMLIICHLF